MASSKLRNSCSFSNLLLSCLNLTLFILSSASIAPIILLKTPPTSFGWALILSSGITIFSSFISFYSQLTDFCFVTHISLLLASLASQVLGFLALFMREEMSLSLLKPTRDPREAKVLVRVESGIMMAMLLLQAGVLVLTCAVHQCWVREYEGVELERAASARRRSRRMARVQEEPTVDLAKGFGNKWVKNDFEG